MSEWEIVAREQIDRSGYLSSYIGETCRLRVPGGWLYKTTYWTNTDALWIESALAFVPDESLDRNAERKTNA